MYGVNSRDYLARAKKLLRRPNKAHLFYAAFELRCCIEARQDEYLRAQKDYVRSIPPRWKMGAQWKALRAAGRGEAMQRLAFFVGERTYVIAHIPVTETLRRSGELLGDLLHSQETFRLDTDPWWKSLQERLDLIVQHAEYCCAGDLLCPALIVEGRPAGSIVIANPEDHLFILEPMAQSGEFGLAVSDLEVWDIHTPPVFYPWPDSQR